MFHSEAQLEHSAAVQWVRGVIRRFSFRFKSSRASRANAATLYLYRLNVNTKVLLALKYTHDVE